MNEAQQTELLAVLEARFHKFMERHRNCQWDVVVRKLLGQPDKIQSLYAMERSGGEPDVVDYDASTDEFVFMDCAAETPLARRNICYDQAARAARKKFPPESSAEEWAAMMGIGIIDEVQYRHLQGVGKFDQKTSSWVKTPERIRGLGGALFCDRRYDTVFVYHNGADSYYSGRAFRGFLRV